MKVVIVPRKSSGNFAAGRFWPPEGTVVEATPALLAEMAEVKDLFAAVVLTDKSEKPKDK